MHSSGFADDDSIEESSQFHHVDLYLLAPPKMCRAKKNGDYVRCLDTSMYSSSVADNEIIEDASLSYGVARPPGHAYMSYKKCTG